ncbi:MULTISPECIES: hypothetical protein [unclassified Campylobacter]|uniref:hypothetical protein n=1 Tax=unclassified Campylobacter TaxID=2593542 RepID=UPI001237F11E|nr:MULTISPECIES: hypothetical protein [unclassified Campylobacter]KAA6225940.1 hypothetical protein FMM57_06965 [Campylobacter sp. LR286c]KAA6228172.1 hypothetical protein FMM54_01095 [Campylobacter sp. LR185c]KAA6231204.1 hypothetical protein FMM58_03770 [Campylobacter sp. LR291e]KAA6234366.1 hypothetical protein FMM56_01015 [Campylobacter sp. LR264d]KAA8603339.1 hypothetical protein CGP82_07770 [Campylobacter sp. LR185c]
MTRTEFKDFIFTTQKAYFDSFSMEKVEELINCFDERLFDELALNLSSFDELNICKNGFFSLKEICIYMDFIIKNEASKMAKKTSIKNYKGTLYNEKSLLESFFYKKMMKRMPDWYKESL